MRALLFDIDGTILLTGGAGTRAINRVFLSRYQLPDAMRDVSAGGKTDPDILQEIFSGKLARRGTDSEITEILADYVPLLRDELARDNGFRTMPGAVQTVRALAERDDLLLGIATGNIQPCAQLKLEHIQLWSTFRFGGYGDDSGVRAELVAVAIRRARELAGAELPLEAIVVIGDTPRDVQAARACGIRAVALPTGRYSREQLAATEPDAVLETLHELPAWLDATG